MARLKRAKACLRIAGDDLLPEEITALLGANPTWAQRKGQEFASRSPSGVRVVKFGQWRLEAEVTEPEDVNRQVSELLGQLSGDLAVWAALSRRFEIDLFCGWFMSVTNEGLSISPDTLRALGERGIELCLDIYSFVGDD